MWAGRGVSDDLQKTIQAIATPQAGVLLPTRRPVMTITYSDPNTWAG